MLTGSYRFDISFLAGRLAEVTDWLTKKLKSQGHDLPLGFFGASTGAAADAASRWFEKYFDLIKIENKGGRYAHQK